MALSNAHDLREQSGLRSGCECLVNLCRYSRAPFRGSASSRLASCCRLRLRLRTRPVRPRWRAPTSPTALSLFTQSGSAAGSTFTVNASSGEQLQRGRQDRLHLLRFGTDGRSCDVLRQWCGGRNMAFVGGTGRLGRSNPWPTRALPARSRPPSVRAFRPCASSSRATLMLLSVVSDRDDSVDVPPIGGIHQCHAR